MTATAKDGFVRDGMICQNRKARHDYHIDETIEAGIQLVGTEVKALRYGGGNLRDAYARVEQGEVYLHGVHISPYSHGHQFNHDPLRRRKLLLHRREIHRLAGLVSRKGCTLVPLGLYFRDGRVKVALGVARGKTKEDRREDLKERDAQLEARRALSEHRHRAD